MPTGEFHWPGPTTPVTTGEVYVVDPKNLGHDERFFDLLEASAQQADTSVHHLIALLERLEQKDSPWNLEEFVRSRRKDKQITRELTEQLCKTFITWGYHSMRRNDGGGNCGWRLVHHSHARSPGGEIATGPRFRSGNNRRIDHSRRQLLRHPPFHNTRDLHFNHGCRRGETLQRDEMDRCRANCLAWFLRCRRAA
jgi:hypothetical protein